jgi:hypothetical protein
MCYVLCGVFPADGSAFVLEAIKSEDLFINKIGYFCYLLAITGGGACKILEDRASAVASGNNRRHA